MTVEPWRHITPAERPDDFVAERRKLCESPQLCFEFGESAICGPCDWKAFNNCKAQVQP